MLNSYHCTTCQEISFVIGMQELKPKFTIEIAAETKFSLIPAWS